MMQCLKIGNKSKHLHTKSHKKATPLFTIKLVFINAGEKMRHCKGRIAEIRLPHQSAA